MVNLEFLLHDADLDTVLREGVQTSRALMLAVEGLMKGESKPDADDWALLRDFAHDTRLLWARASEGQSN